MKPLATLKRAKKGGENVSKIPGNNGNPLERNCTAHNLKQQ
jgi:hypothetical protein